MSNIIIIFCLVCRLYTITHARLSSLMSLSSSCLGVQYISEKPLFSKVQIKYSPPQPLCRNLCLQLKNTVCTVHTQENTIKRGDRECSRWQCCCAWDDDSRPLKGLPSGGGKAFVSSGTLTVSQHGTERPADRLTSSCCTVVSRV